MKKFMGIFVMLLAVFLLLSSFGGTVSAGNGQTRESFVFSYEEYPLSTDGPDSHASPNYDNLRTFHGRDCTHDSPMFEYVFEIGGSSDERFTITERDGGCDYEFNSKTMTVIHKATENLTLCIDGVVQGTVVFSIREKIDWSTMISEGTFVAYGTGLFEDVKIVGTIGSELNFDTMKLEISLVGTVMGWP